MSNNRQNERIAALVEYLELEHAPDSIESKYGPGEWPQFVYNDDNVRVDWMVLTDEEAYDLCSCNIDEYLDDYSAYDTKFHSGYSDRDDHRQALHEQYGRGHWVAECDGREREITINGDGHRGAERWFIYKMGVHSND